MAALLVSFPEHAFAGLAREPQQSTTKLSTAERNESIRRLVIAGIDAFQRESMTDARTFFEAVIKLDPENMVGHRFLRKIAVHELAHWAPVEPNDI